MRVVLWCMFLFCSFPKRNTAVYLTYPWTDFRGLGQLDLLHSACVEREACYLDAVDCTTHCDWLSVMWALLGPHTAALIQANSAAFYPLLESDHNPFHQISCIGKDIKILALWSPSNKTIIKAVFLCVVVFCTILRKVCDSLVYEII